MTPHRLRLLLTFAALSAPTGGVLAQGAPAEERDACIKGYTSLREDVVTKGNAIRAASERHAPSEETCKIIRDYSVAEAKMIKYAEANATQCGTPASTLERSRANHRNTSGLEVRVCAAANGRVTPGQINDFGDPVFEPRRF